MPLRSCGLLLGALTQILQTISKRKTNESAMPRLVLDE